MSKRKSVLISYLAIFLTLFLAGLLHLSSFLITVLFSCLVVSKLCFGRRKWLAVICFLVLVSGFFYGFVYFLRQAWVALPQIVSTSIPVIVDFAGRHGFDLPFTDLDSLKDLAMESVRDSLGYLGNFAKIATKEFALLVIGVLVGIGVFLNPGLEREPKSPQSNLYSFYCALISERFAALYRSFERVMGAQLIISAINTALTAVFVYSTSLRYAHMVVAFTFICGLLPIVGNLISNALIVGIAFTRSPNFAMGAFIFLIVVHKLEYLLNSKIIGSRIRHPMWLMLLALILGERLMGIPGMILAPVILNFIKTETIQLPAGEIPDNTIQKPPEMGVPVRR